MARRRGESVEFKDLTGIPGKSLGGSLSLKKHLKVGGNLTVLGNINLPSHEHDYSEISHLEILDIGTNTHEQIDTHIADTANPHLVTKTQVGLGNVTDDAQLPLSGGTMDGDIDMGEQNITNLDTLSMIGSKEINGVITFNNLIAFADNVSVDGVLTLGDKLEAGNVILNSTDGRFEIENNGTRFCQQYSAYAGLILGYSRFMNTVDAHGNEIITVGTSWNILETNQGYKVRTQFIAPPSGKVEIEMTFFAYSYQKDLYLGLSSTENSYTSIGAAYEYDVLNYGVFNPDESDKVLVTVKWVQTGLTPNTNTTYWVGAKASGTTTIYHGLAYRTTDYHPPIVVKTTALPGSIIDEE